MATTTKARATAFDGSELPSMLLPTVTPQQVTELKKSFTALSGKETVPVFGMIYGPPGSMKTTNAMRLLQALVPEDKIILYVYTTNGWSTLLNYPDLQRRVMVAAYENNEQLKALATALLRKDPEFEKVGAILLDEYSVMVDMDLNWVVGARSKQAAGRGEFKDPDTPTQPDYNSTRIRSNRLLDIMGNLPVHVLLTAHSRVDEKTRITRPDFQGKLGEQTFQRLHFMYYVSFNKENKWEMQTVTANRITAKTRIATVGSLIHNPTEFVPAFKAWGKTAITSNDISIPEATQDVIEYDPGDWLK